MVPKQRRRVQMPDELGLRFNLPRAADQTPAPPKAKPSNNGGCAGCPGGSTPIRLYVWAGLIWYGIPFPKRIRLRRRFPFLDLVEAPGCGCWKIAKDLTAELARAWKTTWRRHGLQTDAILKIHYARKYALRTRPAFRIPRMGGGYVTPTR
jgi:hypothetical protein